MKKTISFLISTLSIFSSTLLLSQAEPEFIVPETDKFQDYFYEALKQKGIENNDLAIAELEKCLTLKPTSSTVFFELGKNYFAIKNYAKSFECYEKAATTEPANKWYWVGMYEVSYKTKNYSQAITTIKKLIEFNNSYREDLVSLYMLTQQFDEALVLINELEQTVGKSDKRELYKIQILSNGKIQNPELDNLINQIKLNPQLESNYVALIKLHLESNQTQKATEIIKKLEQENPNSEWAQVGLFKYFLDKNEPSKAINSMNLVLASTQIDSKIKHRILNEFLIFASKNIEYSKDLEKAVNYFEKDLAVDVNKEVGKFFQTKKIYDKSIIYFERALKSNQGGTLETNKLLLEAHIANNQFANVVSKASILQENYPSEPDFYYFSGLANNQLKEFKKAIAVLVTGLDFVVNNIQLEANFNLQLSEAHNGLGDLKKKEIYFSKARQLLKAKK